jgi:hypothetical protein
MYIGKCGLSGGAARCVCVCVCASWNRSKYGKSSLVSEGLCVCVHAYVCAYIYIYIYTTVCKYTRAFACVCVKGAGRSEFLSPDQWKSSISLR